MVSVKRERESNLELMRIILMLLIIAHHYVVNSSVMELWDMLSLTPKAVFLELWGMWGKTCINAFVLITGYFMCTSRLTWVKVVKLFGVIYFYKVILDIIFVTTGYMDAEGLVKSLLSPFRSIDASFTASFMVMYLLIPFLNTLIKALTRGGLLRLIALLLFVYVVCTTFFKSSTAFSEVGWYVTLYLVAAFIRLYPARWFSDKRKTRLFFVVCVVLGYLSVAGIMAVSALVGIKSNYAPYYFVNDSGKILAFLVGVATFLFFKNLDLGRNRVINGISATVFGVLLIHANSSAMRQWLWVDVVNVPGLYESSSLPLLVVQSFFVMVVVFAVASAIDALRIRFVERPVFNWVYAHKTEIEDSFRRRTAGLRKLVYAVVGEQTLAEMERQSRSSHSFDNGKE